MMGAAMGTKRTAILLLRLWYESPYDGEERFHGRIHPIGDGQSANFDDWQTLQGLLRDLLLYQREELTFDAQRHQPSSFVDEAWR
jgi:hypothetical protein